MVCLAAECRRWQTGQARHAPIQKLRQVPLGSGRARSLDGDRHGPLADGGAVLGTQVAACLVDVGYQIELLGDPNQGADIPNCARTHRSRGSEIGDRRRCGRAQHNLTRNRATTDGVPHRLGRDTVAAAINLSFEYIHIFHVAYFRGERKLRPISYSTGTTDDALSSFRNAKVGLGRRYGLELVNSSSIRRTILDGGTFSTAAIPTSIRIVGLLIPRSIR